MSGKNDPVKGSISEHLVIARFMSWGYQVFRNTAACGIDMLIRESNGTTYAVEVKTLSVMGHYLRMGVPNHQWEASDIVVGVNGQDLYSWPHLIGFLPLEKVDNKKALTQVGFIAGRIM